MSELVSGLKLRSLALGKAAVRVQLETPPKTAKGAGSNVAKGSWPFGLSDVSVERSVER